MSNLIDRYNALALYFSSGLASGSHTGAFVPRELTRVQTWSTDATNNLIDVNAFGQLAALARLPDAPDVTASTSWYVTNFANERNIGLTVTTGAQSLVSCVSGILGGTADNKNMFLEIVDPAFDANGYVGTTTGCIGIGNCFLTNYTLEGAVDGLLTATATFDGLNSRIYSSLDGTNLVPSLTTSGTQVNQVFVLPQYTNNSDGAQVVAIQDYGMVLTASGALGVIISDLKVQNFSLALDLSRTAYNRLGDRQPFSRLVNFPAPFTLSLDATVGDLTSGSLSDLQCQTGKFNASLVFYGPFCAASGRGTPVGIVTLNGCNLNTQGFSASISDPLSTTFEIGGQIGASSDLVNLVSLSGSFLS